MGKNWSNETDIFAVRIMCIVVDFAVKAWRLLKWWKIESSETQSLTCTDCGTVFKVSVDECGCLSECPKCKSIDTHTNVSQTIDKGKEK